VQFSLKKFLLNNRFKLLIGFVIFIQIILTVFLYFVSTKKTASADVVMQENKTYQSLLLFQNNLIYRGISKKQDSIVISNDGKFYYLKDDITYMMDIYDLTKNNGRLRITKDLYPGSIGEYGSYIFDYNDMLFLIADNKLYEINFNDLTFISGFRENSTSFYLYDSKLYFLYFDNYPTSFPTIAGPIGSAIRSEKFSYMDLENYKVYDIDKEEYEEFYEKVKKEIDFTDRSFIYYGLIDNIIGQRTNKSKYSINQFMEYNGETYFLIAGDGSEGNFFDAGDNIYRLDKGNNAITRINPDLQEYPQGFEIIDRNMYIKTFSLLYKYNLDTNELKQIRIE